MKKTIVVAHTIPAKKVSHRRAGFTVFSWPRAIDVTPEQEAMLRDDGHIRFFAKKSIPWRQATGEVQVPDSLLKEKTPEEAAMMQGEKRDPDYILSKDARELMLRGYCDDVRLAEIAKEYDIKGLEGDELIKVILSKEYGAAGVPLPVTKKKRSVIEEEESRAIARKGNDEAKLTIEDRREELRALGEEEVGMMLDNLGYENDGTKEQGIEVILREEFADGYTEPEDEEDDGDDDGDDEEGTAKASDTAPAPKTPAKAPAAPTAKKKAAPVAKKKAPAKASKPAAKKA